MYESYVYWMYDHDLHENDPAVVSRAFHYPLTRGVCSVPVCPARNDVTRLRRATKARVGSAI